MLEDFSLINGQENTIQEDTKFLLDTNILSETIRKIPNKGVTDFLALNRNMILSVVSIQELFFGLASLPDEKTLKKIEIQKFISDILEIFGSKILPVNLQISQTAGQLQGFQKRQGLNISPFDATIAGTCMVLGAVLVTRNVKDFQHLSIPILNPFRQA